MKLTEADVTKQCKDWLEARGWRGVRMNRGLMKRAGGATSFGEPGQPDWLFLLYRQSNEALACAIWIEFKRPGVDARCICATKPPRKRCTACDQAHWKMTERARSAEVWTIHSFEEFSEHYHEWSNRKADAK
jgi:hypothetical protein